MSGREDKGTDWRPFLLFALGPLGWMALLLWGVAAALDGLVSGLRGTWGDDGPDELDTAPRRRYRRHEA